MYVATRVSRSIISSKLRFATLLVAFGASALLSSCKKEGSPAGETIPIGEFASLTGQTATFGQSVHNGDMLAVEEINAAGGVLGKKINLISEDDQSKPEDATNAVQKLISRDHVVALLGEVASTRSLAAAPIAQQYKVPMISPASTNETVTQGKDYVFRICFIDPFQGESMARFAMRSLGKKRAAILTDVRQDYSMGLAKAFRETYSKDGGSIVSEQSYSSQDKDFRAPLTSIKASNPDVIFVPGYYGEVSLIVRQARELGITVPMLGGDGWDSPELTKGAASEFNGTYFSNHYAAEDPDPVVQEFVTKYRKKYNSDPDAMAALGYDATRILADAITRAGSTDGPKLREAIAATKDFLGVTGKITIDGNRNASKPLTILRIVDGKFQFAQRIGASGEAVTPFDATGETKMTSTMEDSAAKPTAPVTAPAKK